jgi:hypothetical protein
MALRLHHIFVCTSPGAPEAEALLDAGLVEGSPNTHSGQGTANRRFFFKSGFLELLWVHNEREAQSTLAAPTKLWDRWVARDKTTNQFGICFSSVKGVNSALPFPSWTYRPPYLSEGRCILFADNLPLSEPEVFVLSWPQAQLSPETEPTHHPFGLKEMRTVSVGLPAPASISSPLSSIREAGLVSVHQSIAPELVIEFTAEREVRHDVPTLGLSIVGRPDPAA